MKTVSIRKPLAALSVAVALSVAALPLLAQGNTTAPASQPVHVAKHARREKHPELRKALKALEKAKTALQNAAHDFGGHRAKALDLTQQAVAEIHLAEQSDQK